MTHLLTHVKPATTVLLLAAVWGCTLQDGATPATPGNTGAPNATVRNYAPRTVTPPPVVAKVITTRPSSLNVPGQLFPQVNSDLSATFQINAPNAASVAIQVDKRYELTKNGNNWTVTTTPLPVGFHYYTVYIDGNNNLNLTDPAAETFYGISRMASGIEIPDQTDFYDAQDVPHGEIRQKVYFSKVTNAWRRCFIYTPPGYDAQASQRYPVLYLQHGAGEDERGWGTQGRVNFILDNLLAEGKAKPMLIVMDNGGGGGLFGPGGGRGGPPGGAPAASAPASGPAPTGRGGGGFNAPGGGDFGKILLTEIIPLIDSTFRTLPDRDHRAMAGLSMGGMQTLSLTMANLDKFSYIGGFSGGAGGGGPGGRGRGPATAPAPSGAELVRTFQNGALADPAAFNQKVKVLFFSIGSTENAAPVRTFHQALDAAGVNNYYYESPGTAHEWQTWRRSLYCFAPLLFKD